ncbi:RRP12-like protein [Penaeus japonicus]|uniref:RRP12-like protein n=1 Tax=Penaeus japonicus TaxID=27405 RepID=UPI001C70EF14|nr:RRP12-like protein [Penaeus japonicus]
MKLKRTSGKGKKWKKGDSCVSNPDNTKFREAARGRFFQKMEGESNLTKEAVAQHEAALSNVSEQMENLGITPEDLQSAGKSCKTFATNFTTCTIPAFEKFFRDFNVSSEQHTRMLAIHAAAQEYMKESGMPETSTSYFCALMISLEGISDSEEDVSATLSLMAKVIRRVQVDVLRARFSYFAKSLDLIISQYQESGNGSLLINALGSMSVLLRAQQRDQWSYPYTNNLLQKIMAFTVYDKPKVRKSAHHDVTAVLKASCFMLDEEKENVLHPAAGEVAEFCNAQLRAASEMGNTKTTLHLLVLLRQVIALFPKKQLKAACEGILSVMQLGNSLINASAMQALYSVMVSKPSPEIFPSGTNAALITALTTGTSGVPGSLAAVIPSMNDSQPACAWITVLTAALMNLCRNDEEEGMKYITTWFVQLVPFWGSEHSDVHVKVFESFEALLEESIGKCSEELQATENFQNQVQTLFQEVEGGMSLQYQPAWIYVFKTLSKCFSTLGPRFPDMMMPCLRNLVVLVRDWNCPVRPHVEHCIGAAVKGLGPKALMSVVPLQITGNIAEDEKHLWVLPLLRRHVKNAELTYFEDFFVHLAGKCFVILDTLKGKGEGESLLSKTYRTVENQIWGMLPSFCDKAKDVEQAMSNEKFARILCDHIKFRDDTRIQIMAAMRNLINDNKENPGRLATYAKNYLPALFNVYLTKPKGKAGKKTEEPMIHQSQRLAAYSTIKTYLQIVPQPKCQEFLNLIMNKYDTETDSFKKQAFLDLGRAFLPYMEVDSYEKFFEKIKPLLAETLNHKEQKAAYKLLEDLLSIGTESSSEFITNNLDTLFENLLQSLAAASPSSRAPRLRCIRQVLLNLKTNMEEEKRDTFLQQVVAETVMCCGKGMSTATRKAAFTLLADVGTAIQKHLECSPEDTVRHSMKLFLAGLVGSPALAKNSIIAITSLTFQFKTIIPKDVLDLLMSNMCIQLLCKSREIVGASLSFILATLSFLPVPVMSDYFEKIFKTMCKIDPDTQRKFRRRMRDILSRLLRKFGSDRLMAMVPPGDGILQKRIRNLRKEDARKKREREAKRKQGSKVQDSDDEDFVRGAIPPGLDEILAEIDSDDDKTDDDDEEEGKRGRKGKKENKQKGMKEAWIKEDEDNIVDLLDPSAGQAVLSKRPKLKPKRPKEKSSGGFEVDDKTGRMIIMDKEEQKEEKKKIGSSNIEFMEDLDEFLEMKAGVKDGKIKNRKRTLSAGSEENAEPPNKVSGKGPSNLNSKKVAQKKRFDYGSEFSMKKAKGDMMKKGKVMPYAYVQFTKDRLNKRKKAKFEGQFTSLVRGARKGVAKGSKQKMKSKK